MQSDSNFIPHLFLASFKINVSKYIVKIFANENNKKDWFSSVKFSNKLSIVKQIIAVTIKNNKYLKRNSN